MAISANLIIGNKIYNLIDCEYAFHQPVDQNGKPCANPKGGIISFTIKAPSNEDLTFHKWMFNKTEVKDGEIKFITPGDIPILVDKNTKTLIFEHAHCIGLHEYFNKEMTPAGSQSNTPHSDLSSASSLSSIDLISTIIGIIIDLLTKDKGSKSEQMLTRITLSAAIIKFGTATFANNELLA